MIATGAETTLNLVEASIEDLAKALTIGAITCVDLVTAYLNRISAYDCRGPALNSIPIINPEVYDEAAASDARRASGKVRGMLDGIPFTVQDSYKVKGLTVACGSPAFQDLIAKDDAFTVQILRGAGAVLIGKTNMCPMAGRGMQQGVYGRAESPYNEEALAAAFASGSSDGSSVSTAASFAAFGIGEETVSSGCSPASNNALVAYTPSRGVISIRGNWPLYPICDVVVPHTRTVGDLVAVLDVITTEDGVRRGDFWRDQEYIELPRPWDTKPTSFCNLPHLPSLQGLRIAVPSLYVGKDQIIGSIPVHTNTETISLYLRARADLEFLGATVTEVEDFPAMEQYELANISSMLLPTTHHLPDGWNRTERSAVIAYAWEQFLNDNDDFNLASLKGIEWKQIHPSQPFDKPQIHYAEPLNRMHYEKLQSYVDTVFPKGPNTKFDPRAALMTAPGLQDALKASESIRKTFFEDWLTDNNFDCVIFPACGDVSKADADVNTESPEQAWRNGVKYSNGDQMIRHLGIPSVIVPMGMIQSKDMPVGLTFLGRAGDDLNLIQWARAYEKASRRRVEPKRTPELGLGKDQFLIHQCPKHLFRGTRPELTVEECTATPTSRDRIRIGIEGFVTCANSGDSDELELEVLVDGQLIPAEKVMVRKCHGTTCGHSVYDFRSNIVVPQPPQRDVRNRVASRKRIARDSTMVVVTASEGRLGWKSGYIKLL